GDRAGSAVALFSNIGVIGASGHKVGNNASQGIAYTYTRSGTSWSQSGSFSAAGGLAGDLFGASVAISGPLKVICAPQAAGTGTGKAYLYGSANSVTQSFASDV